jgi:hypothetical protein
MGQTLESRLTPKRLDEVTPRHPALPSPTNNTLQPTPLSTRQSPVTLPQHIAIIMDGNRRWAKNKFMPAAVGHAAGAKRVRDIGLVEQFVNCQNAISERNHKTY